MLFTRGSSPPWDPTRISDVSRLAGRFLTASATWEARYPTQMRALFSTLPGRNLSRLSQGIPWCSLTTRAWLCKVRHLQGRRVYPHGKLSKPAMFLLKVSWDVKSWFQPGPHG